MRSLLSARELDRRAIEDLLDSAAAFAGRARVAATPNGWTVALAFFEGSLRTRVGFEVAAALLGVSSVLVEYPKRTSAMSDAEDLGDTLRTLGAYTDAILLRHPDAESVTLAAAVAGVPVINCGNGHDEHPTQALIDLMAIRELRGAIDGVRIALVGDLRHMRAAHSLLIALGSFRDVSVRLISPPELQMPAELAREAVQTDHLDLDEMDIVYMAGFAARTPVGEFGVEVRRRYALTYERAAGLPGDARILCPLPRVDEIDRSVDALPQAAYFHQNELGLAVRAAVLRRTLGD